MVIVSIARLSSYTKKRYIYLIHLHSTCLYIFSGFHFVKQVKNTSTALNIGRCNTHKKYNVIVREI